MSHTEANPQPDNGFYVLVTGANSGLGLGIGARLIDEFLQTRPQDESLVLIVTTRDQRKGDATIQQLESHLRKVCRSRERTLPGISPLLQQRIRFRQERLDLLSLVSVQKFCKRLRQTIPKLDAVICNAGIGGWTGVNWPLAIFKVLTGTVNAVSYPTFKVSGVGWLAKPQIPAQKRVEEPPLGEVFCANFFGHYVMCHYLVPLLARHPASGNTKGRIIWVSTLDALDFTLDINDIQAIASRAPYESSKRLTDVMAIGSTLPSASRIADKYLEAPGPLEKTTKPRIYLTHPGICGTTIMALPFLLDYAMLAALYLARWLGSQWHPVTVTKGAVAMVWLALVSQSTLDNMEEKEGVGKWGSATDFWGRERVERTEVDSWGWGGRVGEYTRKGRNPMAKDATKESRQKFEDTAERCWEELEELRVEWEERLKEAGISEDMD